MVILIWALLLWIGVFVLIKYLEVQLHGSISRWLHARNISLYLGYVSWTTTRYDATLSNISHKYRRWWDLWFSLGVTFGLVGLIFSVIILIGNLMITLAHVWVAFATGSTDVVVPTASVASVIPQGLTSGGGVDHGVRLDKPANWDSLHGVTEHYVDLDFEEKMMQAEASVKSAGQNLGGSTGFLTPLLPGINLPKSQIGYILFALLVSALFHELGHALAAGAEELRVNGVGGFLALIFPGAYVQIDGIDQLPPWRQLKVYCAGAWHNVTVSVMCVLAISTLPAVLFPFYSYHDGAVVTNVPATSPLKNHIFPGDVIKSINSETIQDRVAFHESLVKLQTMQSGGAFGFCFSPSFIEKAALPAKECCDEPGTNRNGYQCFGDRGKKEKTFCVQTGAASVQTSCRIYSDCVDVSRPGNGTNCFYPQLPQGQHLHDILVFDARKGVERHLIFQGTPETLQNSVSLSNYLPRINYLTGTVPALYDFAVSLDFPKKLDRLFQYTFSVSLGLAILNMAPVFLLDGEASAILFVRIFRPRMAEWTQQKLKSFMLMAGTILLVGNVVLSLGLAILHF